MNKVYVVLNDWNESTDLFGVYSSLGGARRAISNWTGKYGIWTSEYLFKTNSDGVYRIVTRPVES